MISGSRTDFGLLVRYRRPWFAIGLGLLVVPMMVQLAGLRETVSEDEGRMLGPAPALPRSLASGARCREISIVSSPIISDFGRN